MSFMNDLSGSIGKDKIITDKERCLRLSRDFYWYSQVLDARLRDKPAAEAIVLAEDEKDVVGVLEISSAHGVPVTVHGGGTGNYGQAVPLSGGVVLNMTKMSKILEIGDGYIRAQAGTRLGRMEDAARENGQELRIFPSTYKRSTVAGFIAGGSGGIGSITHGQLWDGNVLALRIVTNEDPPRIEELEGDELFSLIHAYGTTGVITEATVPLAPAVDYVQLVTSFQEFDGALKFAEDLASDESISKRLVTLCEARVASLLNAYAPLFDGDHHVVLLWVEREDADKVSKLIELNGGSMDQEIPYGAHPSLSDLSWNHTTLWARKVDSTWTYLQAGFVLGKTKEHISLIKECFGDEFLIHLEYILSGGKLLPSSLPLIRYSSPERIDEIIFFLENLGISIANPHTYLLEDGGRKQQDWDHIYRAKRTKDPYGLLNPGKLRSPVEATL